MLAAAWGDYTKSQCSAGSDELVSQPVGCDTAEPTTVVQGFACVRTPVQNIRSRDRKRASPMTAFGSEAAERLNRRERPVCPTTRRSPLRYRPFPGIQRSHLQIPKADIRLTNTGFCQALHQPDLRLVLTLGAGNSWDVIRTISASHSRSSHFSASIRRQGFAPGYGGASSAPAANARPPTVGFTNRWSSQTNATIFPSQ